VAEGLIRQMMALGSVIGFLAFMPEAWGQQFTEPAATAEDFLGANSLADLAAFAETERTVNLNNYGWEEQQLEHSESWKEYILKRTQLAAGYDYAYTDNLFLEEHDPDPGITQTIEALIFFADPRGSLLYGWRWEFNGTHHLRDAVWGFNHDVLAFWDYTPDSRYQYGFTYQLDITESPTISDDDVDLTQIDAKNLIRTVKHTLASEYKYQLNQTNALVPSIAYSLFDNQSNDDGTQDRRTFDFSVDIDHDLSPLWTASAGYGFTDTDVLHNVDKDSTSHAARFGLDYEVSELSEMDLLFKLTRSEFGGGLEDTALETSWNWKRKFGERTNMTVGYTDKQSSSFQTEELQFRTVGPKFELEYELTPFVGVAGTGAWRHRKADGDLAGNSGSGQTTDIYRLGAMLEWQATDKTVITAEYRFRRQLVGEDRPGDYIENIFIFGIEKEI